MGNRSTIHALGGHRYSRPVGAASKSSSPKAPRQSLPDELRAIALLGIIVVNAPFIAVGLDGFTDMNLDGPMDRIAAFLTTALAEGKFYLLFSFLFGYSANFIVGPERPNGRQRWRRRLIALALIGLAHAIFFFVGDILFAYAVLGAGLIPLFGRSDRTALTTGAISALVGIVWLGLLVLAASSDPEVAAQGGDLVSGFDDTMASGSFLQAAGARLEILPAVLIAIGSIQWPLAFAAFCLGLVASRREFLADPSARIPLFRKMALLGIGIGLPLQLLATAISFGNDGPDGGATSFAGLALVVVTAPVLSAGYLGATALITARVPGLLEPLRPAGRVSLSIYIAESIVLSALFCGWGFGLFGELGAFAVTTVAFGTWAGLVFLTNLWLKRFRQGPLESLVTRWTSIGSRPD